MALEYWDYLGSGLDGDLILSYHDSAFHTNGDVVSSDYLNILANIYRNVFTLATTAALNAPAGIRSRVEEVIARVFLRELNIFKKNGKTEGWYNFRGDGAIRFSRSDGKLDYGQRDCGLIQDVTTQTNDFYKALVTFVIAMNSRIGGSVEFGLALLEKRIMNSRPFYKP